MTAEPDIASSTHRPRYVRRRRLLAVGMLAPIVAAAAVLAAMLAYPGFNNTTQYLSDLGGPKAATPVIFNAGVFVAGLMAGVAGVGFGLAVMALAQARVMAVLTAVVFMVGAAGLICAAVFPSPDPRHQLINLGLGIQLAPFFLLWALRRRGDLSRFRIFLAVVIVVMAILTVLTKHLVLPGLVNDSNVGWWERGFAVVLVGWVGIAAFLLERRLVLDSSADELSEKFT